MARLLLPLVVLILISDVYVNGIDHGINIPTTKPLIVAHRGSSGRYPEHSLKAYQQAIDDGADVVECDVVVTRDLQLVCLHSAWMNSSTDVHEKFPERLYTFWIDDWDNYEHDYFTVNFTLAELRTLRLRQDDSQRDPTYDGQYIIPTIDEYIQVVKNASRTVALYPEIKTPYFFNSLDFMIEANVTIEDLIIKALHEAGYTSSTDPCFVQCFKEDILKKISSLTDLPLVMLLWTGDDVSDAALTRQAEFCYGIGIYKRMILTMENRVVIRREDVVERAHKLGLKVHGYTFKNDDLDGMPYSYLSDPYAEYKDFLDTGLDGFFTDYPVTLSHFFDSLSDKQCPSKSGGLHHNHIFITIIALLNIFVGVKIA